MGKGERNRQLFYRLRDDGIGVSGRFSSEELFRKYLYLAEDSGGGTGPVIGGPVVEDDFEDGVIDPATWPEISDGAPQITIVEQNGNLEIVVADVFTASGGAAIRSRDMDLVGAKVDVDFAEPMTFGPAPMTSMLEWRLRDREGTAMYNVASMFVSDGVLWCVRQNKKPYDDDRISVPYDPAVTKWRVKHNEEDNTWSFFTVTGEEDAVLIHTSRPANWQPTTMSYQLVANVFTATGVGHRCIISGISTPQN